MDCNGIPIAGARLQLKDKTIGTTDGRGRFSIRVHENDLQLKIVHSRFITQTILLKDLITPATIKMAPLQAVTETVSRFASTVTAPVQSLPRAQTTVSQLDIEGQMPNSVADMVRSTPGADSIGSGGVSVTPTIRGIGRRRVLLVFNDTRIVGDRRAGTSGAFIPTELLRFVEVLRTGASVHQGSDAIGGVIHMSSYPQPDDIPGTTLKLSSSTVSSASRMAVTHRFSPTDQWKLEEGVFLGKSLDYDSPLGTVFHSGYTTRAASFSGVRARDDRTLRFSALFTTGHNIGKPTRENNPLIFTENPYRFDHVLTFSWADADWFRGTGLTISTGINPFRYQLSRVNNSEHTKQTTDTTGLNMTSRVTLRKTVSQNYQWLTGLDWFKRNRITTKNSSLTNGSVDHSTPLDAGNRSDIGLFASVRRQWGNSVSLDSGIRFASHRLDAISDGIQQNTRHQSLSWNTGLIVSITKPLSLVANIGRSFRVPSLSELYYTGITGRKYVIGNPDLDPETAIQKEVGLRYIFGGNSVEIYRFQNRISSLIERFRSPDGTYTFGNVAQGEITGTELIWKWSPIPPVRIDTTFTRYRGRTDTGDPLNDVPASRFTTQMSWFLGRWNSTLRLEKLAHKSDPGPAEISVDSSTTTTLETAFYQTENVRWYLQIVNLTDASYFSNADPDIPLMPGRNLKIGVHIRF
ncbi:MAG: TonB-dependent receptor [Holophagae bacterium]|nr:TonB-dependent receptor [Holophagae bacterium]